MPHGQHYTVVKDYGRYHLRRPPHGQHWVRVDNQYLLVGITSGIIAALVNAQ
jgi:Ni/Co efflux regulator RcnB